VIFLESRLANSPIGASEWIARKLTVEMVELFPVPQGAETVQMSNAVDRKPS
jgi:hypothetical protein